MIDVHIHGGYDIDAMDANSDGLVTLGKEMLKEGVTTYFPTTMTQAPEAIEAALTAAKEAKEKGAHFEYIHLEGPMFQRNVQVHNHLNISFLQILSNLNNGKKQVGI